MTTLAERLERRTVRIPLHECWEWVGSKYSNGYGKLWSGDYKHRDLSAHRAAWIVNYGPIPEVMFVCHKCDNRGCVRPDHLWLGTRDENMQDCKNKERHHWGDRTPSAKLTDDQILGIKDMLADGLSQSVIARIYGISQPHVSKIKLGKRRVKPSRSVTYA